jgi:hypothetical protein
LIDTLHLVIPGLLGPARIPAGRPEPDAPALLRLLSRANVRTEDGRGVEGTLFRLFGMGAAGDWPVAAVTRLGEDDIDLGKVAEGWWLRADPVYLRADLKQVLLIDARLWDIKPEEAQTWVTELNALCGSAGWCFEAPHPKRWYLHLNDDPGLRTHPLSEAIGRDIATLLPQGTASRDWQTRLTEIQMLLHNSPLNETRYACGQPPINSVWLWGGGRLSQPVRCSIARVHAADPLSRGLARRAGATLAPPATSADAWLEAAAESAEQLVVLDAPFVDPNDPDPSTWVEQVNTLEQSWFAPCLSLLKTGVLSVLKVYLGNDRVYTVSGRNLRRFWRRLRPLTTP